jgi:hypothetical protein
MSIKDINKAYFQKSRVFLYPTLEIKRGVSIIPIETYVSWKGNYSKDDCKLICLYNLRNDPEFRNFEKNRLFGNKLFHDFKETPDGKAIYVFDLSQYKNDWDNFVKGKYSKFTQEHKKKIKNFYGINSSNYAYIESFLNPEKYYGMYSQILSVKEETLKEVSELCDKPNFEKENLECPIKSLEMKREIT